MPFVHVRTATRLTPDQAIRIRQGVTRLMASTLRKKAELTAVLVEPVTADASWSVGAEPVAVAAHLDATVTESTNSEEEKTRFIDQAHDLLRQVLGDGLPTATYVVITEVPGSDWGYSGQTQAHRAASL